MKKSIFTVFILIIMFVEINAQISTIDTSNTEVLRLDLKSARGMPVSQVFDDVKFLPLQTTSQSIFGEIYQLDVAKDCYIISDQDTRCILMFNFDGSFRTKIQFDKPTPNFPIEFRLVENLKETYIEVKNGDNTSIFDLNGKLIQQNSSQLVDDGKTGFYFKSENIFVKTNYEIDNKDYEIVLLKNGKEIANYFPHEKDYTRHDQFMGAGKSLTNSDVQNEIFYKRYYDYKIYKITPKGLSLDYKLIFPSEYSLPKDFLVNKDFVNKRIDFIQKNRKVFYGLNNIYKSGYNLFFSGACLDLSKSHKRDFIFNLKTRMLISIQDIEPDALSSYLPVTNLGLNPDFFFHGFHLFKNDYLYNSIPSIDMIMLKDLNPNTVQYDNVLGNYFKTASKRNNPVLVILKPKKD